MLVQHQAGRSTISLDEDTLRRLTADNLRQHKRMKVLEPQVHAALEFDQTQIAKRRQLRAYPGGANLSKSRGSSLPFVATTRDMHAEGMRLLSLRLQGNRSGSTVDENLRLAGVFPGIGL